MYHNSNHNSTHNSDHNSNHNSNHNSDHNSNPNRTQGKQSECMVSDYDSMRLVHRRHNPNKETLIYIPLSHIIVIQVHTMK